MSEVSVREPPPIALKPGSGLAVTSRAKTRWTASVEWS